MRIVYDRFHYATEPIDLPSAAADSLDQPSRWHWPLAVRWYLQARADALADLAAYAESIGPPTLDADDLRWMADRGAELRRRARLAAAD